MVLRSFAAVGRGCSCTEFTVVPAKKLQESCGILEVIGSQAWKWILALSLKVMKLIRSSQPDRIPSSIRKPDKAVVHSKRRTKNGRRRRQVKKKSRSPLNTSCKLGIHSSWKTCLDCSTASSWISCRTSLNTASIREIAPDKMWLQSYATHSNKWKLLSIRS